MNTKPLHVKAEMYPLARSLSRRPQKIMANGTRAQRVIWRSDAAQCSTYSCLNGDAGGHGDTHAATAMAAFLSGQVAADSAGHGRRSCVRNAEDQAIRLPTFFGEAIFCSWKWNLFLAKKQPLLHVEKRPEKER